VRTLVRTFVIFVALSASIHLGGNPAGAEVFGGANVRASFDGWLTPHALPRSNLAPVALHMSGALSATEGNEPPQLQRVTIAINRNGRLFTTGLPICRQQAIEATTTKRALALCRGALVGGGIFTAHIGIPTQAPFPARGRMLAFNSVIHGRRVILAHIYGTRPVPTARVLVLNFLPRGTGTFGTTLSVMMPTLTEDWGYATGFQLTLQRRYDYRGQQRSFISASCPAPRGFGSALFAAAKGTYYLADGRQITRNLEGSCKVSRR
jgi:hypothetical protein